MYVKGGGTLYMKVKAIVRKTIASLSLERFEARMAALSLIEFPDSISSHSYSPLPAPVPLPHFPTSFPRSQGRRLVPSHYGLIADTTYG